MKRWVWLVMGFWLFFPLVCSAGWYKYKDENGVWHYTDSMTAQVPVEKRQKVQEIKEPDDYLTDAEREEKRMQESSAKEQKGEAAVKAPEQERIKNQYKDIESYEALEKKRAELADFYKEMMDKKRKLEEEQGKIVTAKAYKKHQAIVAEFNKSAAEYKARREAYEKAAKAFEAKKKQAQ